MYLPFNNSATSSGIFNYEVEAKIGQVWWGDSSRGYKHVASIWTLRLQNQAQWCKENLPPSGRTAKSAVWTEYFMMAERPEKYSFSTFTVTRQWDCCLSDEGNVSKLWGPESQQSAPLASIHKHLYDSLGTVVQLHIEEHRTISKPLNLAIKPLLITERMVYTDGTCYWERWQRKRAASQIHWGTRRVACG